MSIDALVDIVHGTATGKWDEVNEKAFEGLFGEGGRYRSNARTDFALRAPLIKEGVTYAAYIHPSNPTSGPYSGISFVLFPAENQPCLFGLVVGTQGLSPDEQILGRPGHARKVAAICEWLNHKYGGGNPVAWAKQDPTRTDTGVPEHVKARWSGYKPVFDRYGHVVYGLFAPTGDRKATAEALAAFLDLLLEERGHAPLAGARASASALRAEWFEHLMPPVSRSSVHDLLRTRRYVILQGPPGTGKTKMALDLLRDEYGANGRTIQFHPNTTYETFLGGLAPVQSSADLGLRFVPVPGALMQAAAEALRDPNRPYLLHIDEINRADLGKVLGEAILLFECGDGQRSVELPYDFGEPFGRRFFLPPNLHVLGTMNSSDRSIAIVDIAVRRRFAFVSLWPDARVVQQHGCELMQERFRQLLSIFIEHAGEDTLPLVPGHSYFLEADEVQARQNLRVHLAPLLEEYLAQGYVTGFAEPVRTYLQWLRAL